MRILLRKAEVARLVRDKAYDEALERLYELRAQAPGEADVLASITAVQDFLAARFIRALGGPERVLAPLPDDPSRAAEATSLVLLADGRRTVEQVANDSPLGRFRTLELLVALYGATPRETPVSGVRPSVASEPPASKTASKPASQPPGDSVRVSPVRVVRIEDSVAEAARDAYAYGMRALTQGHHGDARAAFERCLQLSPAHAEARAALARVSSRAS